MRGAGWQEAVEYSDGTAYSGGNADKIIDYLYDTENRWVGENILNGSGQVEHETRFAYDGDQIILQFHEDCSGPTQMTNANLTHRYLWQPDAIDQLMADEQVTNPNAPGNVVFPLTDQEGTIHDLAMITLAGDDDRLSIIRSTMPSASCCCQ